MFFVKIKTTFFLCSDYISFFYTTFVAINFIESYYQQVTHSFIMKLTREIINIFDNFDINVHKLSQLRVSYLL